jgi:Fic family protein
MTPPYSITPKILQLVAQISERIGQINAKYLDKPTPKLRKENRIKTIHSSLGIEGNTLSEAQITAIMDNKQVIGPEKDVLEVLNAIRVYERLSTFEPNSTDSFLKAHAALMQGLIPSAGKFRKGGVGIVSGDQITYMAPPAENVPFLMKDLFQYITNSEELTLIKSCVFHYELEFIHPFQDGNGRMGRLWQTLILMQEYPLFAFLPFENLIHQSQTTYYQALSDSDKSGHFTPFIEYLLGILLTALNEQLDYKAKIMSTLERLDYFREIGSPTFTRKDYMLVFQHISTATASRDLKIGVDNGFFTKDGDKTKTMYRLIQRS